MIEPNAFYFGCWTGQTGHHLWSIDGRMAREVPGTDVTQYDVDARFCPGMEGLKSGERWRSPEDQTEGVANLVHLGEWTVVAFWDRSQDKRGGSNSAFFVRGTHDLATALELSRAQFPSIFARFTFEVRLP